VILEGYFKLTATTSTLKECVFLHLVGLTL